MQYYHLIKLAWQSVSKQLTTYILSRYRTAFNLSCAFVAWQMQLSIFTLLLDLFWSPPTPEGNIWFSSS